MARNLKELQKQYNASAAPGKPGMPMGRGPGRGGPPGMGAKGKPKNTKHTIKRLFKYVEKYKFLWKAVDSLNYFNQRSHKITVTF